MTATLVALALSAVYYYALIKLCIWGSRNLPLWKYALIWAIVCTGFVVWSILDGDHVGTAFNALYASYWWRVFWKNKPPRMRDKVAKLIGAKARAVRDKLVASMPKPSPVRRPVLAPVGA